MHIKKQLPCFERREDITLKTPGQIAQVAKTIKHHVGTVLQPVDRTHHRQVKTIPGIRDKFFHVEFGQPDKIKLFILSTDLLPAAVYKVTDQLDAQGKVKLRKVYCGQIQQAIGRIAAEGSWSHQLILLCSRLNTTTTTC